MTINQNKKHKISGRRQQDFQKAENRFQNYQGRWNKNENDKEAWDGMFILINNAVFNAVNKKLEALKTAGRISPEEIQERAEDITITIMERIKKQRVKFAEKNRLYNKNVERLAYEMRTMGFSRNKKNSYLMADYTLQKAGAKRYDWRIGKLSSYVHNCCLELNSDRYKMWDKMTDEYYTSTDDEELEKTSRNFDYYQGCGFYVLNEGYYIQDENKIKTETKTENKSTDKQLSLFSYKELEECQTL